MKKIILACYLLLIVINENFCQNKRLSITELLINSTTRIECLKDSIVKGKRLRYKSTGTGFFFEFKVDSFKIPVIVTNYHVIKGYDKGIFTFTELIDSSPKYGNKLQDTISNFENCWIKHPHVDLAILPLNPILEKFKLKKQIPLFVPFDETIIAEKKLLDEITAVEEVLMIGYPNGYYDSTNNLPIVRRGITATPLYIDYEGRKEFLLDIPNFKGSSGSPIVLYNQSSYSKRSGDLIFSSRIALVGINVESFNYSAEGKINSLLKDTVKTTTIMPINIAVVIKSQELLGFKPILEELLRKQENQRKAKINFKRKYFF